MRKLIAMVLAMSMVFTMGVNAFAQQPKENTEELFLEPETIQIVGEDGKVYTLTIQDILPAGAGARDSSSGEEGGVLPGTIRVVRATLSNEELNFGLAVGSLLSEAGKSTLVNEFTALISNQFLLNASFTILFLNALSNYNVMVGINGYEAVVEMEWKYFDSNLEGDEGYAWSFKRLISCGTY